MSVRYLEVSLYNKICVFGHDELDTAVTVNFKCYVRQYTIILYYSPHARRAFNNIDDDNSIDSILSEVKKKSILDPSVYGYG